MHVRSVLVSRCSFPSQPDPLLPLSLNISEVGARFQLKPVPALYPLTPQHLQDDVENWGQSLAGIAASSLGLFVSLIVALRRRRRRYVKNDIDTKRRTERNVASVVESCAMLERREGGRREAETE